MICWDVFERNIINSLFFFLDVNHENGCRTAWLGVHPPGTAGHCTNERAVFQVFFFFAFKVLSTFPL